MLRLEGDRELAPAPEQAWQKLSDARFLVECVPDVETVRQTAPEQATCVLRPGFAFVRGTLEVTLRVAEAVSPTSVKVLLHSRGIGSTSEVEASVALSPSEGGGTRAHWTAEVKSLGGLLKAVPRGLIRGAAEKVINDVWTSIEQRLKEETP